MDIELVAEGVGRFESSLPSSDGTSVLRTLTWLPVEDEVRGVVQVVHGMAEHIGRYQTFAIALAKAGYLVVGEDHIGHGKSVTSPDDLGHLPYNVGADIMVADVQELGSKYRAAYPDVPFFLFGHSMGSFIARRSCARYGNEYAGAILCGTGNPPVSLSLFGNSLCRAIGQAKGETFRSKLVEDLCLGTYNKAIENPRTAYDWLSCDEGNVDRYVEDPLCGFMFSVGGFGSLTILTAEVAGKDHAADVPAGLPLLFVAGGMDPVGSCGTDVVKAVELYRNAGVQDVSLKLYPGLRHEILNEREHEQVEADILAWIEAHR